MALRIGGLQTSGGMYRVCPSREKGCKWSDWTSHVKGGKLGKLAIQIVGRWVTPCGGIDYLKGVIDFDNDLWFFFVLYIGCKNL
jgi:hypothetical protein